MVLAEIRFSARMEEELAEERCEFEALLKTMSYDDALRSQGYRRVFPPADANLDRTFEDTRNVTPKDEE